MLWTRSATRGGGGGHETLRVLDPRRDQWRRGMLRDAEAQACEGRKERWKQRAEGKRRRRSEDGAKVPNSMVPAEGC